MAIKIADDDGDKTLSPTRSRRVSLKELPSLKFYIESDGGGVGDKSGQPGEERDRPSPCPSTYASVYKSLWRQTREALPNLSNYRNFLSFGAGQRPTMEELHGEDGELGFSKVSSRGGKFRQNI